MCFVPAKPNVVIMYIYIYVCVCVCVCVSCVYVYVYICVLMSLQIVEISKRFSLCIVMASVKFTLNDRNVWKAWM